MENNWNGVIYKKEGEYLCSVVKYKFGIQASHKYYFLPDGRLYMVKMKLPTAFKFLDEPEKYTELLCSTYHREHFSYFKFLAMILLSIIGCLLFIGFVMFFQNLYIAIHHIYWHHKKYKFVHNEEFKNFTKALKNN